MALRSTRKDVAKTTTDRRMNQRLRSRTLTDGKISGGSDRSDAFLGSTVDLSLGGACIRTYEQLTQGMRVALRFRLPNGDLAAMGEVTHVTVDPIGCRLAGVRFEPLAEAVREHLANHLATVKPPEPKKKPEGAKDQDDVEVRVASR